MDEIEWLCHYLFEEHLIHAKIVRGIDGNHEARFVFENHPICVNKEGTAWHVQIERENGIFDDVVDEIDQIIPLLKTILKDEELESLYELCRDLYEIHDIEANIVKDARGKHVVTFLYHDHTVNIWPENWSVKVLGPHDGGEEEFDTYEDLIRYLMDFLDGVVNSRS